jgi:hypothetical protein
MALLDFKNFKIVSYVPLVQDVPLVQEVVLKEKEKSLKLPADNETVKTI